MKHCAFFAEILAFFAVRKILTQRTLRTSAKEREVKTFIFNINFLLLIHIKILETISKIVKLIYRVAIGLNLAVR